MVTIMEGAKEVGQLGQNPDPLETETAQASCEGAAHIVCGGGVGGDNAPPKKSNDCLKVIFDDQTGPQTVPKLLPQVSIKELHNSLVSDKNDVDLKEARY